MPFSPVISIVVPMRNEARNVGALMQRLRSTLDQLRVRAEVICIDDGSLDDTLVALKLARATDRRIKIVSLSRNFGKETALAAGLRYARGQAAILMDADLQHPPELVAELVAKWREGYEMVYAQRRDRASETVGRRWLARAFYRVFGIISRTALPHGAGDFRLLDRKVINALNQFDERTRFTKGLYSWVGFRQIGVPYHVVTREGDGSRWSLLSLWRFAVDGITSFSTLPLRVWSYLGILVSFGAAALGSYILLETLIYGSDVPGYASLIVTILFLSGVQLVGLGVMGEYIGRIFDEVKRRPLYLVREELGFQPGDQTSGPGPQGREIRLAAIGGTRLDGPDGLGL